MKKHKSYEDNIKELKESEQDDYYHNNNWQPFNPMMSSSEAGTLLLVVAIAIGSVGCSVLAALAGW